ncbi:MAG: response regulator [Magnetococcales bacterium]|nr:response regulator [Magnetococcales bacterium]
MASILVIDDDPDILTIVRRYLESSGHEIDLALSGSDGLESFRKRAHDLIITDIFMPKQSGLTIIQEIRRIDSNVKIIAFSGGNEAIGMGKFMLRAAEEAGAAGTLEKPFTREELVSSVEEALSS